MENFTTSKYGLDVTKSMIHKFINILIWKGLIILKKQAERLKSCKRRPEVYRLDGP